MQQAVSEEKTSEKAQPSYEEDVAKVLADLQASLDSTLSAKADLEEQLQVLKTQKQVLQAEIEQARCVSSTGPF